jgi:homospermidine synthase
MHPLERTLYVRQMALRRMINRWGDNTGPTACVDHGANPGLVSHFTRQALTEIGERVLREDLAGYRRPVIEHALAERQYNLLAEAVGLRVVHISERDTQITNVPKEVNEFVNTWSVEGFYEEGTAPAEMGWGTHERRMPDGAYRHHDDGPCNQICLPQMGIKTWVRSWVPCGEITGMVVRHGEAFSISDHLTVWGENGHARYRPTVHYAYCPADVAINSLHELEMRNFDLQSRQRILEDHEIVSGRDEMGVLLMGHDFKAWWCGSLLSIDETRAIVPGQNATTLQVAASVIAATAWMCDNPEAGLRIPDELPWDYILGRARPYLGTCFSESVDWDPLSTRNHFFSNYEQRFLDPSDPWQFVNFQV